MPVVCVELVPVVCPELVPVALWAEFWSFVPVVEPVPLVPVPFDWARSGSVMAIESVNTCKSLFFIDFPEVQR